MTVVTGTRAMELVKSFNITLTGFTAVTGTATLAQAAIPSVPAKERVVPYALI
jgi:hypothetical protein